MKGSKMRINRLFLSVVICAALFVSESPAKQSGGGVQDVIDSGDSVLTANNHYRTYEIKGGAAEFACDNLRIRIAANSQIVSIKHLPSGKELLDLSKPNMGFYLVGRNRQIFKFAEFHKLSADTYMVVSKHRTQKVIFSVVPSKKYIAFRIKELVGISKTSSYTLMFGIEGDQKLRPMPLDYMTFISGNEIERRFPVTWPVLWLRGDDWKGEKIPRGGFALYLDEGEDHEDDVLAHIWANEGLPHPKVEWQWNVPGVKRWMKWWTEVFSDRSSFWYSHPKGPEEFERLLPYLDRMDVREVHFYHWIWRDNAHHMWVKKSDFFPNGRDDLMKFAKRLKNNYDISLSLHYNWCEINLDDALFVGTAPRKDLAGWGTGKLAKPIDETAATIYFEPDPGVELPSAEWHDQPPPALNHWAHFNFVHIDNEIIKFDQALNTENDVWVLRGCTRGVGSTEAASHDSSSPVKGLVANYGFQFIPETFSPIFDEMIKEQTDFWNESQMTNMTYDGANPHYWSGAKGVQIRRWLGQAYSQFDHPVFYETGHGAQLWGHFEHYMNSFKVAQPIRMGFRGDMGVRPRTASICRAAATVDEAHLRMAQVASVKHSDFSMHIPLHYESDWEKYGRFEELVDLVRDWKEVSKKLTDAQRSRIRETMEPPLNRGFTSKYIWWLRKENGATNIYPQKNPLTRRSGDVKWGCQGGEVGWVTPQQYIKFGDTLELENPYNAQPPQFSMRVMSKTDYKSEDNILLFTDISALDNPTEMKLHEDGAGMVISYDNKGRKVYDGKRNPLFATWKQKLDLRNHRAVGMYVTGDNSGAILVIRSGNRGRDYALKIDFTGKKYVEIPNGEAFWADSVWGGPHRCGVAKDDYQPGQMRIGLGYIPENTQMEIKVEGVKALREYEAKVINPTIILDDGKGSITVKGTLKSSQRFEYSGGSTAIQYDENFNVIAELGVVKKNYEADTGYHKFTVTAKNKPDNVWLSTRFITEGEPIIVE